MRFITLLRTQRKQIIVCKNTKIKLRHNRKHLASKLTLDSDRRCPSGNSRKGVFNLDKFAGRAAENNYCYFGISCNFQSCVKLT